MAVGRVRFRGGERGRVQAAIQPGRDRLGVQVIVVGGHDTSSYCERSTSTFLRSFAKAPECERSPSNRLRSNVPGSSDTDEMHSAISASENWWSTRSRF